MVTLPELDSYIDVELKSFTTYSPLFSHYLSLVARKPESFSDSLRIRKHRHWLECAFATLTGQFDTEDICFYWTQKSNELLSEAWKHCQLDREDIALLAQGKLGSNELNLSSDIDIIFIRSNDSDVQPINTKIKKFIQLLSENTSFGFAYRVDTSLRPGGDISPIVPTLSHFFNYFDEYTEAWNRMSFIRLRPVIGCTTISNKILSYCHRLSYPRRLDFSVIEEIKNIRTKLEYQWKKSSGPLDIKYHPGGIRDIELYIHALQVIYGGRHPQLKNHSIRKAMTELHHLNMINTEDFQFLNNFYWELRTIENHIHIFEDKHSYVLKERILSKITHIENESSLNEKLNKMSLLLGDFFTETPQGPKADNSIRTKFSEKSQQHISDILNLKSHSLKRNENEKRKKSILDKFLEKTLDLAIDPDLAIEIFRDFIFAIKSKSSIFHLLDRHDELLENLSWLFSISPYVGQVLCRRPELLDSFALGKVDLDSTEDLETLMENLIDYKLLGQLVAIIYLLKNKDVTQFTQQISHHADLIVYNLMQHLEQKLQCNGIKMLCMGKWSGFELGTYSDLDFVFLSEHPATMDQMKFVRRFINLLATSTRAGKLYDIDLRLKPNESSGPLLIQESHLLDFLKNKAEAWQKQAYLRSRMLGQSEMYFKNNMELLWINETEQSQLETVHQKLLSQKPAGSHIDIKHSHGGLIHTEFTVQKLCLKQKLSPTKSSTEQLIKIIDIDPTIKNSLTANYLFLRRFEQIFQVCNTSSSTKVSPKKENLKRIAKLLDIPDAMKELERIISLQHKLLKSLT